MKKKGNKQEREEERQARAVVCPSNTCCNVCSVCHNVKKGKDPLYIYEYEDNEREKEIRLSSPKSIYDMKKHKWGYLKLKRKRNKKKQKFKAGQGSRLCVCHEISSSNREHFHWSKKLIKKRHPDVSPKYRKKIKLNIRTRGMEERRKLYMLCYAATCKHLTATASAMLWKSKVFIMIYYSKSWNIILKKFDIKFLKIFKNSKRIKYHIQQGRCDHWSGTSVHKWQYIYIIEISKRNDMWNAK